MDGDPFDVAGIPMTKPGHENNWLGTDYLGRDIWAGLVHGGRATLAVGFVAAMLSVFIGVLFGALSGFYGGWVAEGLMPSTEFFPPLTSLLFAMVLVIQYEPTLRTLS